MVWNCDEFSSFPERGANVKRAIILSPPRSLTSRMELLAELICMYANSPELHEILFPTHAAPCTYSISKFLAPAQICTHTTAVVAFSGAQGRAVLWFLEWCVSANKHAAIYSLTKQYYSERHRERAKERKVAAAKTMQSLSLGANFSALWAKASSARVREFAPSRDRTDWENEIWLHFQCKLTTKRFNLSSSALWWDINNKLVVFFPSWWWKFLQTQKHIWYNVTEISWFEQGSL